MSGNTSRRYPVELRERAVRMVAEIRADHDSEWAAMTQVASLLGIRTPETVRRWCRQVDVDAGVRPGVTTEESAELKRLKRENAELKRANAILKAASPRRRSATGCRADLRPAQRAGRQDHPVDLLRAPRPSADRPAGA